MSEGSYKSRSGGPAVIMTGGSWKERYEALEEAFKELQEELEQVSEDRLDLQNRLDEIAGIAAPDAEQERENFEQRVDRIEEMLQILTNPPKVIDGEPPEAA